MSTTEGEVGGARRTLAEVRAGGNRQTWIRPIAGSGRRLVAFLFDNICFVFAGQVFAWSMPSTAYSLGPRGPVAGQLAALLYFGLMDSRAGGGQTIGKRMMEIAVRGADGKTIGIGRSILRTSIWVVPMTLSGWSHAIVDHAIVSWSVSALAIGIGAALVATMMFDRGSGQRLDDMLTRSYVVYLRGAPVDSLPAPPRHQWIVAATATTITVALAAVFTLLDPFR